MRALAVGTVVSIVMLVGTATASAGKPSTGGYLHLSTPVAKKLVAERRMRTRQGLGEATFIKVGDSNSTIHRSLYGLGCLRYQPVGLRKSLVRVVRRYRSSQLLPGRLDLPGESCAIGRSSNSFSRISLATRGGTTFDYALSDPAEFGMTCTGTVLSCEMQEVSPRYAFIQFGTNEALFSLAETMATVDLEKIRAEASTMIDLTRSKGVSPVFITAPVAQDGPGRVPGVSRRINQINQVIRELAKSRSVVLIDLWVAVNREIGSEFDFGLIKDGVHLSSSPNPDPWVGSVNLSPRNRSRYGMNLRSYLILNALEKMDALRD